MAWMPPEPGWLGKLIDSVDPIKLRYRARKRLEALGVTYCDMQYLNTNSVDVIAKLAGKYRR